MKSYTVHLWKTTETATVIVQADNDNQAITKARAAVTAGSVTFEAVPDADNPLNMLATWRASEIQEVPDATKL